MPNCSLRSFGVRIDEVRKQLFESFEAIAIEYESIECWSARELYPVLGYAKWERFKDAIARAKESCINAGESPDFVTEKQSIL